MTDSGLSVRCGLILHDDNAAAERLLAGVVADLRRGGRLRLGGVIQDTDRQRNDCTMTLEDLATGDRFALSQALGRESQSCRLDPDAMARASMILRAAIARPVDLLIVNKFSKQESEGKGLAADLFNALAEGIPVLVPLHRRHWPAWEALAGPDVGQRLAPTSQAITAWLARLHPMS